MGISYEGHSRPVLKDVFNAGLAKQRIITQNVLQLLTQRRSTKRRIYPQLEGSGAFNTTDIQHTADPDDCLEIMLFSQILTFRSQSHVHHPLTQALSVLHLIVHAFVASCFATMDSTLGFVPLDLEGVAAAIKLNMKHRIGDKKVNICYIQAAHLE